MSNKSKPVKCIYPHHSTVNSIPCLLCNSPLIEQSRTAWHFHSMLYSTPSLLTSKFYNCEVLYFTSCSFPFIYKKGPLFVDWAFTPWTSIFSKLLLMHHLFHYSYLPSDTNNLIIHLPSHIFQAKFCLRFTCSYEEEGAVVFNI